MELVSSLAPSLSECPDPESALSIRPAGFFFRSWHAHCAAQLDRPCATPQGKVFLPSLFLMLFMLPASRLEASMESDGGRVRRSWSSKPDAPSTLGPSRRTRRPRCRDRVPRLLHTWSPTMRRRVRERRTAPALSEPWRVVVGAWRTLKLV
eukprot:6212982-Pleurochrysis_carterae.AAC.4